MAQSASARKSRYAQHVEMQTQPILRGQFVRCNDTIGDMPLVATPGTLARTSGIITTIVSRPPIKSPPRRADLANEFRPFTFNHLEHHPRS
jgi:hypothetical protein